MPVLLVGTGMVPVHAQSLPEGDSAAYRESLARTVREAAERVLPAVVTIEIIGAGDATVGEVRQDASTSGVVVDGEGYILASSLVVKRPAASLLVLLPDGSRHAAKVVARDQHRDLILLKIEPTEPLRFLSLPEKISTQVGQTVIAVGRYGRVAAPLVSTGVLSAVERLDGIALQTDARVSPAFYGGPLIDLHGNLLGILIPAVAEGGAADETSWYDSGIAFAIPADVIQRKLERLRSGEDIQRGLIGIVAKSNDPYENDTTIAAVRSRSPAEEAGLKVGDEVISVAGFPVRRHQQIKQRLGPFDAGETIELEVRRDGESRVVKVTLVDTIPPLEPQRLGIVAVEQRGEQGANDDMDQQDETGRLVVDAVVPGSPAEGLLAPGDVIERVADAEVREERALRRLLITADPDVPLSLNIRREESTQEVSISSAGIAGPLETDYPEAWSEADPAEWSIESLNLPDAANQAAVVRPKPDQADPPPGTEDQQPTNLGLLVYLLNPGQGSPKEAVADWLEDSARSGVVVCAIAPEDNGRWQAKEIEVVSRMVASLMKQLPIDSAAVAVVARGAMAPNPAEAADSMALAVAMTEARTFAGVAVSEKSRPPAIQLRDNDPAAFLQLLLPISPEDELPGWGKTLQSRGYPIVRGGAVTPAALLRWTRLLQAI